MEEEKKENTIPPSAVPTPTTPLSSEPQATPVPPSPAPSTPPPSPSQTPPVPPHRSHTFEDDFSLAMNATDASVVQELLETAREKEMIAKEVGKERRERKWLSIFSILLVILATSAIAYGYWYYRGLTVPAEKALSVGVFQNLDPVVVHTTDIRTTIQTLTTDTTLPEGKPVLIPIVTDNQTLTPLSTSDFFNFIEANPSEPFEGVMEAMRLGAMNTGTSIVPFIITAVPDIETASKEFLIAEPTMVQLFYKALNIDLAAYQAQVGGGFEGKYLYNIPVRILNQEDSATGAQTPVILYGQVSQNIIVITTDPSVLKAIYDAIIRQ